MHISFSLILKYEIINMCNKFGLEIKGLYGDYSFGEFTENSEFMNFLFTKQSKN